MIFALSTSAISLTSFSYSFELLFLHNHEVIFRRNDSCYVTPFLRGQTIFPTEYVTVAFFDPSLATFFPQTHSRFVLFSLFLCFRHPLIDIVSTPRLSRGLLEYSEALNKNLIMKSWHGHLYRKTAEEKIKSVFSSVTSALHYFLPPQHFSA